MSKRASSSPSLTRRQRRILTAMLVSMGGILLILVILVAAAPDRVRGWLGIDDPAVADFLPAGLQATFPATWTPSRTPGDFPTATRKPTLTITPSPSASPTRAPTATFTPPATVPAGWFEYESKQVLYAFHMPAHWIHTPLVNVDAGDTLTGLTASDPVRAASIRDGLGQAVLDDLVLIAFDSSTFGELHISNVTVARASTVSGKTVEEIYQEHLSFYEAASFYTVLASDQTTVDYLPAYRIRYTTPYNTEFGELTIYHVEVIAETRREVDPPMIFTFSTAENHRNINEALFDRITATIRWIRKPIPTPVPTATPTRDRTQFPDTPTPVESPTPEETPGEGG